MTSPHFVNDETTQDAKEQTVCFVSMEKSRLSRRCNTYYVRVEPNENPFFAVVDVMPTVSHAGPRYYPRGQFGFSFDV